MYIHQTRWSMTLINLPCICGCISRAVWWTAWSGHTVTSGLPRGLSVQSAFVERGLSPATASPATVLTPRWIWHVALSVIPVPPAPTRPSPMSPTAAASVGYTSVRPVNALWVVSAGNEWWCSSPFCLVPLDCAWTWLVEFCASWHTFLFVKMVVWLISAHDLRCFNTVLLQVLCSVTSVLMSSLLM